MPSQPDMNAKAPRPKHLSDEDEAKPDIDHPPARKINDKPSFDRATAAEEQVRAKETVPGADDFIPDERSSAIEKLEQDKGKTNTDQNR